jgi:LysR family transcriptional regulator, low CO2-responsive transcriptional regulator
MVFMADVPLSSAHAREGPLAHELLGNEFMAAIQITHAPEPVFDARQLRLLVVVDETGSLSAAARRLSLTQSAVSHALRRLEEDAGQQLVERNERGASLTTAGQSLARHATAILERMTAAREELQRLQHWGNDRLRVGASSTACQYLLPQVLCDFRRQRPKCRVEVSAGDTAQRLDDLRAGRIDLAIVAHSGLNDPGLESVGIFHEPLCLVMPPGAAKGGLGFIGYCGGSSYGSDALQMWKQQRDGHAPPALQLESLEAIRALVVLGLGCAVLPRWLVRAEIAAGTLMTSTDSEPPNRTWAVVYRRGRRLSVSENTWIARCTEHGLAMVREVA